MSLLARQIFTKILTSRCAKSKYVVCLIYFKTYWWMKLLINETGGSRLLHNIFNWLWHQNNIHFQKPLEEYHCRSRMEMQQYSQKLLEFLTQLWKVSSEASWQAPFLQRNLRSFQEWYFPTYLELLCLHTLRNEWQLT